MAQRAWRLIDSTVAYDGVVRLMRDRLRDPDGGEMEYCFVAANDGVAVLAFTPEQKVVLTKQYRHAVRRDIYELPAGEVDDGESPRQAAIRELREETGYRAGTLRKLGVFLPAPSVLSYPVHVFAATAVRRAERDLDHHEAIDLALLDWRRLRDDVHRGRALDVTLAYAVMMFEAAEVGQRWAP